MSSRRVTLLPAVALIGVLASRAIAQVGFNIDLDDPFGDAQSGTGAPSSSFGAAAGPPGTGYWNGVGDTDPGPTPLRNLLGQTTPVIFRGHTGVGGGYNFGSNTGDYALLLNDGNSPGVPGFDTWSISNLITGEYLVYTYAVFPDLVETQTAKVTVSGSSRSPQYVTGPMPGDSFILGATHSIDDIFVTTGTITIQVDPVNDSRPFVNGFQIIPVPEPGIALGLALGIASLVNLRQRRGPR